MEYIVQIGKDCWLAPWEGDPGRTLVKDSARRFSSITSANRAITEARKVRPASRYTIVSVETIVAPARPAPAEKSEAADKFLQLTGGLNAT